MDILIEFSQCYFMNIFVYTHIYSQTNIYSDTFNISHIISLFTIV